MTGSAKEEAAPEDARLRARAARRVRISLAALLLVVLAAFAYSASVVDHFPGEVATSTWVQSWQTSWLDAAMRAVSSAGEEVIAAAIVLLAAAALAFRGRRGDALLVVSAPVVGYGLRTILKLAIGRPRPTADVVQVIEHADGFSFPSGHVMHYVVFLGALAFVLWAATRPGPQRWLVLGAVAVGLAMMGLSRIYLGVHWLGDVVGGYAFGAVVLGASVWTWRRFTSYRAEGSGLNGEQ